MTDGVPKPRDEHVRRRMEGQRRRDTGVELELRSHLHRLGLRFRVDRSPFSGMRSRADVVFGPSRVAVFVNGCFWHGCEDHMTWPKSNAAWWRQKIGENVARDWRVDKELASAGWLSIRVWEHDDLESAAIEIYQTVEDRRT